MLHELYTIDDLEEFSFEYDGSTIRKIISRNQDGLYSRIWIDDKYFNSTNYRYGKTMWDRLGSCRVIWLESVPIIVWTTSFGTRIIYKSLCCMERDYEKCYYINHDSNFIYLADAANHNSIKLYWDVWSLDKIIVPNRTDIEPTSTFIDDPYISRFWIQKRSVKSYTIDRNFNKYTNIASTSLYKIDGFLDIKRDQVLTVQGNYKLPLYENFRKGHPGYRKIRFKHLNFQTGMGRWFGSYYIYGVKSGRIFAPWSLDIVKYLPPCYRNLILFVLCCLKKSNIVHFIPMAVWKHIIFSHMVFALECSCYKL